ncbi:hypothetical protein [Dyella subtropica]|uniref:hypothetical protein n=1 Tax=Dyella subtropica TaxID=2992127 RepID=UPI00224D75C4|nr:hypothetical protein [Dyella subtropica]
MTNSITVFADAPQQPSAALIYRKSPVQAPVDLGQQVKRIEQHVTRKVVHEIAQATPWRGHMEKAMLTPRMVHELAEQVAGLMTRHSSLERYRRGL